MLPESGYIKTVSEIVVHICNDSKDVATHGTKMDASID